MADRQTKIFIALSIILFFSGSYSLIYQIAWVRFLTLLLGSTTMGITTVVSTFMGGLAIGSWLASKYLIGREKPLKVYALLELIIAFTAALSPLSFNWAFASLPEILQKFGEADAGIFILRIIFSAVIMLVPTICMGAALPVLGKYLQLHSKLAERKISIIYGLNTIGACVGSLVSGYILLRSIGLLNTIYVTAGANFLLFFAILTLKDDTADRPVKKDKKNLKTEEYYIQGEQLNPGSRNIILAVSAIVGFIGLASELVWTRMIVLTVGGSIYAFSTILTVYLLFYGIGAALGGASLKYLAVRFKKRIFEVSRTLFFLLLFIIPVATTFTIVVVNYLPVYYINHFDARIASEAWGLLRNQLMPAVMLMSAATLLSGIFFSYGLFMMKQHTDDPAANTAYFYTWNTIGCIAGTISAAFFLIPYLGLDHTLRVTSTILIAAGIISVFIIRTKKFRTVIVSAALSAFIVWFAIPAIDKIAVSSGSGVYIDWYQDNARQINGDFTSILNGYYEQLYYRDGFTATITTSRDRAGNQLFVSTNGKNDGSSYSDMPTQKLLAHLPAFFHPAPKEACVIGYGTGTTVGSLALHPGIKIDAIEIEPAIIEAAEFLRDYNNDPLSRDNVKLHLTDGRLHLQRSAGKYDLITSEPSNPWIAGVSDLFTTDFYKLADQALKPDGVFGQWIHMYQLNPEALKLVFRTFREVFPDVYVFTLIPDNDLLLVGCKGSYRPAAGDIRIKMANPLISADLAGEPVNIRSEQELMARLIFGPDQVSLFAGGGPVNTDVLPVLSYIAPLSMYDLKIRELNSHEISRYRASGCDIIKRDNDGDELNKINDTQLE